MKQNIIKLRNYHKRCEILEKWDRFFVFNNDNEGYKRDNKTLGEFQCIRDSHADHPKAYRGSHLPCSSPMISAQLLPLPKRTKDLEEKELLLILILLAKKTAREVHFPMGLIDQSLNSNIETAKASTEDDRRHILISIVGKTLKELDDKPSALVHEKYDTF